MPSPLEIEINSLLHEHGDSRQVAAELIKRWRHQLLNEAEQVDCAQFLLATGQHSALFTEVRRLIGEDARLPWAQLTEALGRSGIKPDDFEVEALFCAATQQNALPEMLRSRQLDLHSRAFGQKRAELMATQEQAVFDRKQALHDKIQFMRSQRMFEQELALLDEMQALFPGDERDVEQQRETLRLRWAREVVANARSGIVDQATKLEIQSKLGDLTPEMETAKNLLVERVSEIARSNPVLAYDLAMGLQMMDLHVEALEVLRIAPPSPSVDWLRLELLVCARKFVTALDEAARLEENFVNQPDAAFACAYARARALHGLGEKQSAIEILSGLVRIRPHYRSAQSLLLDWTDGEA